jgi:hypothetical protein
MHPEARLDALDVFGGNTRVSRVAFYYFDQRARRGFDSAILNLSQLGQDHDSPI